MRPKSAGSLLLGGATILPLLYLAGFFGFLFYAFLLIVGNQSDQPPLPAFVWGILPISLLMMTLTLILATLYVISAARNACLADAEKLLWVVVLCFGAPIAMPIYWYLYFWRKESNGQSKSG